MDKYISREELRKHLKECYDDELFDADMKKAVIGIDIYVENMPSADVQPVKHGRWELITQNKFTGTKTLRCTYCKNYFVIRDDTLNAGRGDANFCPNCGSENRMDGDSDA